jgi:hypothetical protein
MDTIRNDRARRAGSARVAVLAAGAVMLAGAPAYADEGGDARATLLELGVSSDGTGARGGYASVDVPFGSSDSINAEVGHTSFDDFTVRRANGNLTVVNAHPAERYELGYRHGFGDFGLNFDAQRWGNNDLVRIDDFSVGFDYQTDYSDWSLDLIDRAARVTVDLLPGGPRHGTANAWGLSGGFGYLTDPVDVYLSLGYYDYGHDLDLGPIAARLGNNSPLGVADSLVDRSVLVGGRHQFAVWSFGLEAAWYRSAIGGSQTRTADAVLGFPISRRFDIELTLGAVNAEQAPTTGFGTLAMRFALGGA